MGNVCKYADVPYSAEQMYNLVNDIEAYPEYLPWCTDARVYNQTDRSLTASVTLATGKIKQTFTTENTMKPEKRIDIELISGPFKHLSGYWEFTEIDKHRCRIELNMDFEFKNRLLKMTLKTFFNQFMNSLVGSFTKRAGQIYS